ncbi:MAG: VOC family protein [Enterobacterales bacterium]|nr:VOC family protein [Enterobacterales bacterium]
MEKVLAIGGLFFRSNDPKKLAKWYRDNLGINLIPTGADQTPWKQEAGTTAFAPFAADSDYFGDAKKMWMINFRVADLDAMVLQLEAVGIKVTKNTDDYSYGKFARLNDPEGNPIELWQPLDGSD